MAATTISRATWTDGVSGTVIANARLQADIYDKIDSLIAANIIFGGTVGSEGFGTHLFSAGGSGANQLTVRNTTSGSTNKGLIKVMGNAAEGLFLEHLSSTWSTAAGGSNIQNSSRITNDSGVLSLEASTVNLFHINAIVVRGAGSATTTGSMFHSDAGASASFNGFVLASNLLDWGGSGSTRGTQANTGLSSWAVDIGGTVNDLAGADTFGVLRRAAAGSWVTHLAITSGGAVRVGDGSASAPVISFLSDTNTGIYRAGADALSFSLGGVERLGLSIAPHLVAAVAGGGWGTGTVRGSQVTIGANTSGAGAAASISLGVRGGGVANDLWFDVSGNLRCGPGLAPTEDNSTSDTGGTVVGTQTSSRSAKDILGPFTDRQFALRTVVEAPIYRFRYKPGRGIQDEDFVGIVTDDTPVFGMDGGKSLNVVNAIGYLIASVQALAGEIEQLKAAAV